MGTRRFLHARDVRFLEEVCRLRLPAVVAVVILFSLICESPGKAVGQDVLTTQGSKFYLDDRRFDMWGVRTVNALWDDAETAEFLEAMAEYKQHGVNTVGINLQGGGPGFDIDPQTGKWYENNAFNSDGSLKQEYKDRLRRILERAEELDMVINLGYFYQRQCRKAALTEGLDSDHWDSDEAIYQATRNATEWLKPYRNVFLDIVNEFGHEGFQYENVFPHRTSVTHDQLIAKGKIFIDIVHEVDPDRLCGLSPTSDQGIFDIPGMDVAYTHGHPQEHLSGNIPQVNNEQLCRYADGVYNESLKATIMGEALQERYYGNYWFWHSTWLQFPPFHFRADGDGTSESPGDGWIFRFIAQASVPIAVQIVQPASGVVRPGEVITYEAEAFDESSFPIADDSAFEWRLREVGSQNDLLVGSGKNGTMQIPRQGSYSLTVAVTDNGQTQYVTKLLITGDPGETDFSIGVQGVFPSLAADDFGRIHLVYASSDGLHYMWYDQYGWSADERIPNSTDADMSLRQAPVIDTDSFGNPHVAWGDGQTGLHYTNRLAGSWQERQDLGAGRDNEIVVDSHDNVWVIYRAQVSGEVYEVRARQKTAGSSHFGTEQKIYGDGSDRSHCYPAATAGCNGEVFVVFRWDDGNGTTYDPFFAMYDGSTWTQAAAIVRTPKKVLEGLDIVTSRRNIPYVAYYATDGVVWVARRDDQSWYRENTGIGWDNVFFSHEPRIAIDAGGKIYIVSCQGNREEVTESNRVVYSVFDPATGWSSSLPISEQAPVGNGQADVTATSNSAFVVWNDLRGGLYFRILGDGEISANEPPVVNIQATPQTGPAPLTVQFTGENSSDPDGEIVAYYWEFGDGTTSMEANPLHTYVQALGYEPRLYVTDDDGATKMDFAYVEVTPGQVEGTIGNLSPTEYSKAYVKENDPYYVDSDYRVVDIPHAYEGLLWVKTKNGNKANSGLTTSFDVGERVQVYVVHDSRVPTPSWLSDGFIRTQDIIQVSDSNVSDFRIWRGKRAYDPGETVVLGENGGQTSSCSMYVVLIRSGESFADFDSPAAPTGIGVTP